jgi:hypothetical protein
MATRVSAVDRIALYAPHQSFATDPLVYITREEARYLRDQGLGVFGKGAKVLRLTQWSAEPEVRGRSCRMSVGMVLAFVQAVLDGRTASNSTAIAAVDAWEDAHLPEAGMTEEQLAATPRIYFHDNPHTL